MAARIANVWLEDRTGTSMRHCFRVFYLIVCLSVFAAVGVYADDAARNPAPQPPPAAGAAGVEQVEPKTPEKAPAIEFRETDYNFREAFEGETISYDFKVRNVGTEVLEISQVRPG